MNTFKAILSLLLLSCTGLFVNAREVKYAFVYQHGYWRAIDTSGETIVDTVYSSFFGKRGEDCRLYFSEGMVAYLKDNKCGFKDMDGKVVVPAVYEKITFYKNGFARVAVRRLPFRPNAYLPDLHWGLIDHKGKLVADTIYDYVGDMDNEGTAILVKDNRIGVINDKGILISPFIYQTDKLLFPAPAFADGLLPVLVFNRNEHAHWSGGDAGKGSQFDFPIKTGFIDRSGKLVVDTIWDLNMAMGSSDEDERESSKSRCGFARNSYLMEQQPAHPFYVKKGYYSFSNGQCVVIKGGKRMVINTHGDSMFVLPDFGRAEITGIEDKNGFLLIRVLDRSGPDRKSYAQILDRAGNAVPIPVGYRPVDYWQGNVVIEKPNMHYKLVNKKGQPVTDTSYRYVYTDRGQYAQTNLGLIDSLGRVVTRDPKTEESLPVKPIGKYENATPYMTIDLKKW